MFGRPKGELKPPPISKEKGAREVLRVWGGPRLPQQFVVDPTWDDPGAWGLMLVDIAKHAARAYGSHGHSVEETLERIKTLFDAEWDSATDSPTELQ